MPGRIFAGLLVINPRNNPDYIFSLRHVLYDVFITDQYRFALNNYAGNEC